MVGHLLLDSLLNSILITGLVVIMMMMIECFNVDSRGNFFTGLRSGRVGQVVFSALLGSIPGCLGGFAAVSLFSHGMISFGALIAMMIASSGDEAFVMLAMIPDKALWIFGILFVIAVVTGVIVDCFRKKQPISSKCCRELEIHEADCCDHKKDTADGHGHGRHLTLKRTVMFVCTAFFIAALASGMLEHEHGAEESVGGINLLSEEWMNVMFAILSLAILIVLIFASDHFVEEHLWHHIIKKHLPSIFLWSFGVLAVLNVGMHFLDITSWISENTALMIVLATLVGIIPESGPHLIFVTLFASGAIPLPVLLASCISQDGHACLPLIAESKRSFFFAKIINCAVALAVGFSTMLLF